MTSFPNVTKRLIRWRRAYIEREGCIPQTVPVTDEEYWCVKSWWDNLHTRGIGVPMEQVRLLGMTLIITD